MYINEFIHLIETKTGNSARKSGHGYTTCCPAHDDINPSLSITEGAAGKILIKCFTGCTPENICASLELSIHDLFPEKAHYNNELTKKRVEYPYYDEKGRILYLKIRIEPGFNGKSKSFYWERVNDQGEVVKNLVLCKLNFCRFGCVKTPGFNDRKASCIELILRALRSLNRGSFHVSPNGKN